MVTRFNLSVHFDHYKELSALYYIHGISDASVPALGFVYEASDVPVAYAFIRRVEGGYGQIDGLIANPNFHGEIRNLALDEVIQACIKEAKAIGITSLFSFCEKSAPIKRAIKHGFVDLPHTLLAIDLTKEV